jgi:hypothetical protein
MEEGRCKQSEQPLDHVKFLISVIAGTLIMTTVFFISGE